MALVSILQSSFLSSWSTGDGGSLDWLEKNIGNTPSKWKVIKEGIIIKGKIYSVFWFENEEDAISFKLRWI